mmetsp:Transcript_28138/g.34255  ORF Transcript_28138/g.34255 Transcript_28138/m.34255 type:complete len:565 (+) Transcript_28138:150-1844(+)|eukprot:CAMPEP_0172484452 /NCGR_PEP_ID=MMETSP1066-20121228/11914_1 /TAXON_ID=671091 /ORGANISM="Coscinodiscus wailesii, Strain CCMP2513" /LENGTH=564 /DNA_ID=CAMNT_0013248991 /DNA_START=104 /DNA_END=1801 /DNA_ORIENTATION=+
MAWRSSGSTNEEMVNNLKRFKVISSEAVERGFRKVDRKFFVPKGNEDSAYADQPLKEGSVHISAPHIYGSALEALELQPDSSLSFLNIGSGTGYLSCIVAEILGRKSLNFGIEINQDVVRHSHDSIKKWRNHEPSSSFSHLEIIRGNALNVTPSGESMVGFDRIYIGASVDRANLRPITKLLSPGGILVGPVDDELVKVIRIGPIPSTVHDSGVSSPSSNHDNEFTQQVLSGVRFAPLLTLPAIETTLPARIWRPDLQVYFPDSFQRATEQIFMCSNAGLKQSPPVVKVEETINPAAMLPRVIWIEILSFTHRKWFDSKQTETQYLKKRLFEEQQNAAKAQQARIEAETRCQVAERERDVYRLLARRWQSRLQLILQQQRQLAERDATGGRNLQRLVSGEERAAIFGLGAMLHPADSDDDDEDDETDIFFLTNDGAMEEDDEETEEIIVESSSSAMLVNDDEQLIDFLDQQHHQESDEEEYEFQSLQSEEEDNQELDTTEARRLGTSSAAADEDNNSVIMDDDIYSEAEGDNSTTTMVMEKNGNSEKHRTREQIRTVSMGSEDL